MPFKSEDHHTMPIPTKSKQTKEEPPKYCMEKQIHSLCVQEMCWKIQRNRMKTIAEEKKDPEISCQYRLVIPIKTACSTSRYALHDHPQQKRHRGHTKVTITAPKPCHGNFPQRYTDDSCEKIRTIILKKTFPTPHRKFEENLKNCLAYHHAHADLPCKYTPPAGNPLKNWTKDSPWPNGPKIQATAQHS